MRPIALLSALLLLALTACAAPPPEESPEPEPSPALSLDLETLERTMSEDRYAALTGFLPVLEEGAPLSLAWGETEAPEDIFISMHVYDRLPDFLRAVFWCLFEKKEGLDFAAPAWKKEEFAGNAGRLMYAIHSILPEYLRRRAGYVSYTEQPVSREPFYFSKEPCGANCINLSDILTINIRTVLILLKSLGRTAINKNVFIVDIWLNDLFEHCQFVLGTGNDSRTLKCKLFSLTA